jgi:hypothetical protein
MPREPHAEATDPEHARSGAAWWSPPVPHREYENGDYRDTNYTFVFGPDPENSFIGTCPALSQEWRLPSCRYDRPVSRV